MLRERPLRRPPGEHAVPPNDRNSLRVAFVLRSITSSIERRSPSLCFVRALLLERCSRKTRPAPGPAFRQVVEPCTTRHTTGRTTSPVGRTGHAEPPPG